jgi:hypothetical protein
MAVDGRCLQDKKRKSKLVVWMFFQLSAPKQNGGVEEESACAGVRYDCSVFEINENILIGNAPLFLSQFLIFLY